MVRVHTAEEKFLSGCVCGRQKAFVRTHGYYGGVKIMGPGKSAGGLLFILWIIIEVYVFMLNTVCTAVLHLVLYVLYNNGRFRLNRAYSVLLCSAATVGGLHASGQGRLRFDFLVTGQQCPARRL